MPDLDPLYELVGRLVPCPCMEARFMQQALVGLLLLAPLSATMGVQVVNFRMAFFTDAIGHSAFTGVAIGLLLAVHPHWTTLVFGVLVGLAITAGRRRSRLAGDTVIGVVFAGVVAFGLAVVSARRGAAGDVTRFLYGDILTIDKAHIWALAGLTAVATAFQVFGYNRLLYIGLHPTLARVHRVRVAAYQYLHAALLAAVVIFSVWAVGVLLVTALCIVPAAAARNLARSAGGMAWWAWAVALVSAVGGLVLSAQPWAGTATGATVVLVAFACFLVSQAVAAWREGAAPR